MASLGGQYEQEVVVMRVQLSPPVCVCVCKYCSTCAMAHTLAHLLTINKPSKSIVSDFHPGHSFQLLLVMCSCMYFVCIIHLSIGHLSSCNNPVTAAVVATGLM